MAVLDGHHDAGDPTDPVGSALGKIVRALPEPVAAQAEAVRRTTAPAPDRAAARPDPEHHDRARAGLLGPPPGAAGLPVRGRLGVGRSRSTRGRSSSATAAGTCCAGRTGEARAGLPDRPGPRRCEVLDDTFVPPADLDPVALLEEHLAVGWEYEVEVVIDAPFDAVGALRPPRARAGSSRSTPAPAAWSAAPATRLVRRAARRDPGAVPDRGWPRAASRRPGDRGAAAGGGYTRVIRTASAMTYPVPLVHRLTPTLLPSPAARVNTPIETHCPPLTR